MKTRFNAFTLETDSFDITAEETLATEFIKRELNKHSETARKFLANKQRQKYYIISGFDTTFAGETDCWTSCFVSFTDEEVEFVSRSLIDIYNKGVEDSEKIPYGTNILELCKDMPISEITGENSELDNLFEHKICGLDITLEEVNFDSHFNLYSFSLIPYDSNTKKTLEPIHFRVELSDEQYIYMLTQKLLLKEQFNYNRLVLTNPTLAQKITHSGSDILFDRVNINPYIVEFTEIDNDIQEILAQLDK